MTKEKVEAQAEKIEADFEEKSAVDELVEEASTLEELEKELEESKAQADEYLDGWQRARAELSNYKKRQEVERVKVRELANAQLLRKLLPIVDDFERAALTLPSDLEQLTWIDGILLIMRKFKGVLESEGVEPIETEGESFDPFYHEAVTHEETPDYEDGQIIGEVQRGYMLGERVLRPALVRVAKAPSEQETSPDA